MIEIPPTVTCPLSVIFAYVAAVFSKSISNNPTRSMWHITQSISPCSRQKNKTKSRMVEK